MVKASFNKKREKTLIADSKQCANDLFNMYKKLCKLEKLINEYDWQLDTWATFGRFGLVFTKKLFGLKPFNAYISCFMMVVAIVLCGNILQKNA